MRREGKSRTMRRVIFQRQPGQACGEGLQWCFMGPSHRRVNRYDLRTAGRGFTIAEIIIVVVIIAIAAMIMVPMMSSAASMQLQSAANMIAADLEYAKSTSISRGQMFSVVFNTTEDSYRIEDQNGAVIGHPVKKGFDYVIDLQDAGLDKVDITNVNFDATNRIKFDYMGSPYNGNGDALNNGIITLQGGGATTTITVEPVTGYIIVSD